MVMVVVMMMMMMAGWYCWSRGSNGRGHRALDGAWSRHNRGTGVRRRRLVIVMMMVVAMADLKLVRVCLSCKNSSLLMIVGMLMMEMAVPCPL